MDATEGTTVKLKEHLEKRMCEMQQRFDIRLESMQDALRVANKEIDRRLIELNALRQEVTDDRGQFVLLPIYQIWHDITESRITKIETKSATRGEVLAIGLVLAGLVIALLKMLK